MTLFYSADDSSLFKYYLTVYIAISSISRFAAMMMSSPALFLNGRFSGTARIQPYVKKWYDTPAGTLKAIIAMLQTKRVDLRLALLYHSSIESGFED
jgi:hypothetical protein